MIPVAAGGDASAREIIRTGLDRSLCVEAAAGTGKTTELVNRIAAVLATGRAEIDRIVAVTFTNKAAGELKLRLRQKLDELRDTASGEQSLNVERAIQHLEDAAIGTIHAFCAQILRERPVEAGIDPAFVEAAEQETRALYRRAFRCWFERSLQENPPGLRRALARLAWGERQNASATEDLQYAGWKLIEWRDFPAPWSRPEWDRCAEIDTLVECAAKLAELVECCPRSGDSLVRALAPVREFATSVARAEATRARDYDTLEALLIKLPADLRKERKFGRGMFAPSLPREDVIEFRRLLIDRLESFRRTADADLAALLQGEMRGLVDRYDEMKTRAGRLDFTDLLIRVRNLVRDNGEVRSWLQHRFTHIFVDEFQDTDPLQAELLVLLSSSDASEADWMRVAPVPGKLFLVGDPKQSIYRFRRADVQLYQEVRDRLADRGVEVLYLSRSFRAVPDIQGCVNAAFEEEMRGHAESAQARYVALEEVRNKIGGQPGVVALPVPRPYTLHGNVAKTAIAECLPDAVAGFIEWLANQSGWRVCDPDSRELRPIRCADIAVLFRRFIQGGDDLTRPYVRALEAREIPHLLVGSKSFHEREEVETVRAACTAIEWPGDEFSVYATLHGPLFGFDDATLLRYRAAAGRLHPLAPRDPAAAQSGLEEVAGALDILARLHRGRNRRPIADSVGALLSAVRAPAGLAFRPGGNQVLGNVYRVVELARSFEAGGGISFRGFVDELNLRAERADSAEAPMVEEAAEGVRLMTVHSAKGLEFPVVILADMNANLQTGDPDRFIDAENRLCAVRLLRCAPLELTRNEPAEAERDKAEGVRVAYVAATRARDLLVVPVVGDGERDGWLGPLNKALYPRPDRKRWASAAAGCPQFGTRSVLERPLEMERGPETSVAPGAHKPRCGSHEVVWWDPAVLHLRVQETFGLPRFEMLIGDPAPSRTAYQDWQTRRESLLKTASRPSLDLFTPSEAAAGPEHFETEVRLEKTERQPGRPAGARFGVLVHALLRDALARRQRGVPLPMAEAHARAAGLGAAEAQAALAAVERALAHPFLERALAAERLHRELPLMYRTSDGRMLEGIADLAFFEKGRWVVADFKTDADLESRRSHYESQLRWYALALGEVTGMPVSCVLLGV